MNPILRNTLAVITGIIIGMVVNGGIISLGPMFIDPPAGVDVNDIESIKANFHLYGFKDFLIPFLAHALGTLIGAIITAKIAVSNQMKFALGIGVFFLIGGIAVNSMIYHSIFSPIDILFAYIPMGWLGAKIAQ